MRQRSTGPLVYTIKSGVLFVCLFVMCVMGFTAAVRTGRAGCPWKALDGEGCATPDSWRSGPGRGDTEFQSIYGPKNGQKMEKMAKIGEILENHTIPTLQKFCYLDLPMIW